MANIREINDQRVRQLAETLKRNGLAASESEAINMARSMAQTEAKVNTHFNNSREGAIMNTGGRSPVTLAPAAPVFEEISPYQTGNSQEKEAPAQAVSPQRPSPAPTHSNNALNQAITNVQQAYNQPQTIDLGADFARDEVTLFDVASADQGEPSIPEPTMQEPSPLQRNERAQSPDQFLQRTPPQPPAQRPVEQVPDSDGLVPKTQEIFERPPRKDISQFAESKINLADVFNTRR